MLELMPHYVDSFKKHMDLPPNFHLHTGVALSNVLIASLMMVSTLYNSQTDYFGLGKPGVVGEDQFQSLLSFSVKLSVRGKICKQKYEIPKSRKF
jgi:hypothetical protein